MGRQAYMSAEAARLCAGSRLLICVFIFGAPTEEGFEDFQFTRLLDSIVSDWLILHLFVLKSCVQLFFVKGFSKRN